MDHEVLNSFSLNDDFSIYIVKSGDKIKIEFCHYEDGVIRDDDTLTLSPLTWQCLVDGKNTFSKSVQKEPVVLNNSLVFSIQQVTNYSFLVVLKKFRMEIDFSRHFFSPVCFLNETQWQMLYITMDDITQCVIDSQIKHFINTLLSTVSEGGGKDKTIESKLADSMYEILCDHLKTSIKKVSDCYVCFYNLDKRDRHDCKILDSAQKLVFYRDLAWCGMDFKQLAREFISKNEYWADYMKQFLLDKEKFKNFTKKAENMYLMSSK
ncbi:hypothetical protein NPIL_258961 [Nephila pilipes]|uniref:Uncharacterized protein n=1 Tax=Nephila pilipes TaxID=299642 RepID=A0A8X6QHF8_NEPPI|nr:hypothetical protein NPIL_258961 [Nephila pilipes]